MTAKGLPTIGTRVAVYEIDGVDWPGKEKGEPLRGVVTYVGERNTSTAWQEFYILPDEPDRSYNTHGETAAEFFIHGWLVYNVHRWKREQFVINELEYF